MLQNQRLPEELIEFGAVYLNRKRILQNANIEKGAYVRVHPEPNTYASNNIDWGKRVFFENENFLVVDKPANIPCQPTLDNFNQNVLKALENQIQHPLFVTQRLDVQTSGLCLYAKRKKFQRKFNRLLQKRGVRKWYIACVSAWLRPQSYTHFMHPSAYAPKKLEAQHFPGAKQCQLRVLYCKPAGASFEALIELLTGRTHQIRAQLGFLKCGIVGDNLYGAPGGILRLRSVGLSFRCPVTQKAFRFSLGLREGGHLL